MGSFNCCAFGQCFTRFLFYSTNSQKNCGKLSLLPRYYRSISTLCIKINRVQNRVQVNSICQHDFIMFVVHVARMHLCIIIFMCLYVFVCVCAFAVFLLPWRPGLVNLFPVTWTIWKRLICHGVYSSCSPLLHSHNIFLLSAQLLCHHYL